MNLRVPFSQPSIDQGDIDAVSDALRSGWLTSGVQCERFEEEFAALVEAQNAISTASCTAALFAALKVSGIKAGDAVVVPTMTFTATAEAVVLLGAIPVFADIDPRSLMATRETIEAAAKNYERAHGPTIRAVIAVHYGGAIGEIGLMSEFCAARGLVLINDCAHCLESRFYDDRLQVWKKVGALPGISCFSFYANKCITTCDGGMITTNDKAMAHALRLFVSHGINKGSTSADNRMHWDYSVDSEGFKLTMPDPLAALGRSQLRRSRLFHDARQSIAEDYNRFCGHHPLLAPLGDGQVRGSSHHLYVVRLREAKAGISRDALLRRLLDAGIMCSVHWKPLHLHPVYNELKSNGRVHWADLPESEAVWTSLISLPMFPGMTHEQIDCVCGELDRILHDSR